MDRYKEYWRCGDTRPGRVRDTFGDHLPRIEQGEILDMGCSLGYTTEDLADIYPTCTITGIDIDKRVLRQADESPSKKSNIRYCFADGYKSPFPPETFDAIVGMNNLSFAYERSDWKYFKKHVEKITRMVKPQGYLCISGDGGVILKKENEQFKIIYAKEVPLYRAQGAARTLAEKICGTESAIPLLISYPL